MDRDGNRSNPYRPDPEKCCEACVFGRGQHSDWCPKHVDAQIGEQLLSLSPLDVVQLSESLQ